MNFFQSQQKAKRNSFILLVLFLLAIASIVLLLNLFLIYVWYFYDKGVVFPSLEEYLNSFSWEFFLEVLGAVLAFITLVSVYKFKELSRGGHVIAEALGGELISPTTLDYKEKQLLNIVEEIAIASGIPSVPVYVLQESSINAFVAGLTYNDAVIGVTSGALRWLTREELQGVIAHEFSHIFNGDMRLNIQTTGLLHGILIFGHIGDTMLEMMTSSHKYVIRPNSPNFVIFLIAYGFLFFGSIGKFFGNMIKSLISKQREFLADASAVQYTRSQGLVDALKKIGAHKKHSYIKNKQAKIYSHFYFSNGIESSLFQTHPPLQERIKRLDPRWNGEFIATSTKEEKRDAELVSGEETPLQKQKRFKQELFGTLAVVSVLSELENIGQPSNFHVKKAHELLTSIPPLLLSMTKEPFSAQAIIFAFLLQWPNELLFEEESLLEKRHKALYTEVKKAQMELNGLSQNYYLHLIQLCLPALKTMSKLQYNYFKEMFLRWIYTNQKLSLFEWSLKHLIFYPLEISFNVIDTPKERYSNIYSIKKELELFLSVLAYSHSVDKERAEYLFEKAKLAVGEKSLSFHIPKGFVRSDYELLDQAILKIQQSKLMLRKKIFIMAVTCLSVDEKISAKNTKVLYAIATTLGLPLLLRIEEI